jgi:hypothetical protein
MLAHLIRKNQRYSVIMNKFVSTLPDGKLTTTSGCILWKFHPAKVVAISYQPHSKCFKDRCAKSEIKEDGISRPSMACLEIKLIGHWYSVWRQSRAAPRRSRTLSCFPFPCLLDMNINNLPTISMFLNSVPGSYYIFDDIKLIDLPTQFQYVSSKCWICP